MPPSIPLPVQDQLDAITLRLALLDGAGISPAQTSQVAQLRKLISGLKKTLGNVNLGYQTEMKSQRDDFNAFKAIVTTALSL